MSSYYSRFALTGSDDPVTFTVPYIDKFGLGVYNFDLCTLFKLLAIKALSIKDYCRF